MAIFVFQMEFKQPYEQYTMIYFDCDYMAGGHPEVMNRLNETNLLHTSGYGTDEFTHDAEKLILDECGIPEGKVYFMVGGTQTNAVVIDRLLSRNDGVIATETAHISVHEAGAIELSGHKILTLPESDGKLTAVAVDAYMTSFFADETNAHMVRPAMVYISFPTELGTVYSREELQSLYDVCGKWGMPLYIDGARLAYGLAVKDNGLTIKDIAHLCDVFYIGGTKCGALFGEAVVTRRPELLPRFFSLMKMHGAILAKGRLLGVQFQTLFKNGLYSEIGRKAVELALRLKRGFMEKGLTPYIDSPTNQQFFILPNDTIELLRRNASFELWGPPGETESIVRFVTDWTTTEADCDAIIGLLPD